MFTNTSFSAPNFQMGDSGGDVLGNFLNYRNQERIRQDNERANFEAAQAHLKKMQENQHLAMVMNTASDQSQQNGILAGVNGIIAGSNTVPGGANGLRSNGMRVAPFDPSLDQYRRGQLELGKSKLEAEREKEQNRNVIADRGMDVKERLAGLKDMPDSQKAQLLQEGKITLQEIRDADEMKRLEVSGKQKTGQIEQEGNIRKGLAETNNAAAMSRITKQGENSYKNVVERGNQDRLTKGTPAPGTATAQSETQKKVGLQSRAIQALNTDPTMADVITFNEQGFPVISDKADPERQMDAYKILYGTQHGTDVNLPVETSVKPPSSGIDVNKGNKGLYQATSTLTAPPTASTGGAVEMYTPDGKSTRMVPAAQVEVAKKQGYKPKSGG